MKFSGSLIGCILTAHSGFLSNPISAELTSNLPEQPQDFTDTICNGRPRSSCEVDIDVPSACASTSSSSACPIVFFLHGSGGTNDWFARTTGVHDAGLIGVYPQGEGGWNTGPKSSNNCAWDDFDCTTDPDEGDFIASIITVLRDEGANGNIYVIGNSNGGALAHRLASNAGDALPIKGIVAKVTQLLESPERSGPGVLNYNQPRSGTPKVSVLSVMGTSDGLIPYDGGSSAVFGGESSFQLMPALVSMTTWSSHNGCSNNAPVTSTHSSDMGNNVAIKYEYTGCPDDVIVEHYEIQEGGHNSGGVSIDAEKVDYILAYDFINRVEEGSDGGGNPPATTSTPPTTTSTPPTTPAPCSNDDTWAGKFNAAHTCDYVAENPDIRCNYENSDGVKASVACPVACDSSSCVPVTTPVPPTTTSTPPTTTSTTPTTTSAPPTTPDPCSNDDTWAGKFNVAHTCDYVAEDPDIRCNWESSDAVLASKACLKACAPSCNSRNLRGRPSIFNQAVLF